MKDKKNQTPNRQCISCRSQIPRDKLTRITKTHDQNTKDEKLIINPDKYQFGRSVYLCKNSNCITTVVKSKKIAKMLKASQNAVSKIILELEKLASEKTLAGVKA